MTNQKHNLNSYKKSKFKIVNSNAAGIDIGSESHYVCVPPELDSKNIRSFGSFTRHC